MWCAPLEDDLAREFRFIRLDEKLLQFFYAATEQVRVDAADVDVELCGRTSVRASA